MLEEPNNISLKVVDHVDAMLGYWDKNQRCKFANAAYQVWFGKTREQVIGREMKEVLGHLYELNLPHIEAVLRGETQVFEREIPLPDGTVRHSLASYYPDIVDGEVVGFSVQVADVTRLKELERQLVAAKLEAEKLATHDFLTGLPNRVQLEGRISFALSLAQRSRKLSALAVIDLDGFKEINDNYGHEAGDAFLKQIAARMLQSIRSTDTIVRQGGDEFILVICEADSVEHIHDALERLTAAACEPFECRGNTVHPSLSCGVAVFPAHGNCAEDLLHAADSAMYKAKAQGKRQIMFAS